MARWTLMLSVCAMVACGTLAPDGGGASNLPVSGAGPYKKLVANDDTLINEPVVLEDAGASLDDAQVLANGEALMVWVTRRTSDGKSSIRRADLARLEDGPMGLEMALAADQAWEMGAIGQPAVILGTPSLIFYSAGGGIGYARSDDAMTWEKAPGPALTASSDETAIASPAAVMLDGKVRLFYSGAGGIYAADAALADLAALVPKPFTKAGLLIPAASSAWASPDGRFTARTVVTVAGRPRYDLFLTGSLVMLRTVGFAASFDGTNFEIAGAPFLDPKAPEEWAPTVTNYRDGALLLFSQTQGNRSVIAGATSP
jgi:hypothetical protein